MATTTITGTINGVNNTALANKWITFRLVQLGTDSGATATVAQSVDSVQTDANGDFSIDVWNNGDSGKTSVLEITVEGSKAESVIIPTGTASIELWDLIENYQADGSTSEQVPVVSSLFVRKSNNLSDLGSAATSRTNLGVAIGTDVQAHSAILDSTTASFTTADEIKLDGIEALADVTDATNIAASGGYVAGGVDVALADGGTGASDATTARTNLGVAIGSDVQAHSTILDSTTASFTATDKSKLDGIEALANVTDATSIAASGGYVAGGTDVSIADGGTGASNAPAARTNLNVPSNAEALLVANDLNDVNAPAARTNLGVAIGSNVQAHSATLDATTASFTTAKDAAISTNTANIASNDADIGAITLAVVQNETDIATNAAAIALNTAKVGITPTQASDITTNNAKVGITTAQATAIATNTANIASNDTDIGVLTGSVVQNQTDIATNATDIATNATDIATNATSISNAEDAILSNIIAINDISAGLAQSTVIVKQASDLAGILLSNVVYFIDGIIDMGSQSIEVPAGGLSLIGSTFGVSQLTSTAVGYTMFTSPASGSGNLLGKDLGFETSGTSSKVFDLISATGLEAFEFARINFNNCTSLGTVDNYRQGLEEGGGRFGGSPSLILKGAWAGGYRITTSIVRSLAGTMTAPLFSAGAGFVMQSRFLTDINCDLPTLAPLLDFSPLNFPNPSTLQFQGAIVTRDGASDANDANITPNVTASDLCSEWRGNVGLNNTFVGGEADLSAEVATALSDTLIPAVMNGTWTTPVLVHFDSPVTGQLRHLGKDPKEFRVTFDFVVESTAGNFLEILLIKNDGTETTVFSQKRVVNNVQGGPVANVAYFSGTAYVNLNQNDFAFWKIQLLDGTAGPATLKLDSQFNVEAR